MKKAHSGGKTGPERVILRKGRAASKAQREKGRNRARPLSSRLLAVKIILQWFSLERGGRPPLEDLASDLLERHKGGLRARDAALVRQIVFGVIRWQRLLEWHIRKYAQKFGRLPIEVQTILYSGAYQIIFLSRIPFFAAVDESVKAAEALGAGWAKGLVNAVLRKVAGGSKAVPESAGFFLERCRQENFPTCAARFSSHPTWMVRRWTEFWGRQRTAEICFENNRQAPLTLRLNPLKTDMEEALRRLNEAGIEARPGGVCPQALVLPDFRGNPAEIPGFGQGWFSVQDQAAQLVSMLLSPGPGQRVLDACAGVGGKATHLAEIMGDEGEVLAFDPSPGRLALLRENSARLGIGSISILDGEDMLRSLLEERELDGALVDAPCSGLGVIRRHPDIKWNRTSQEIPALAGKQLDICLQAASGLKPGGRLVYSVCTLEPEETLQVADAFLEQMPDFMLVPAKEAASGLPEKLVDQHGFLRIWPGTLDMDGFFAAVFQRRTGA